MNEQQMVALVERVGDRLEPDVSGLVAAGASRGRSLRRRRRATTAGVAVAGLAVVASIGFALAPADSGTDRGGSVATDPTPTSTPTSTPAWTPTATSSRRFAPDPGKTGAMLASMLVGDVTKPRSSDGWSADDGPWQLGSALLDGAQVTVLLEHVRGDVACQDCRLVDGGYLSSGTYDEHAPGHYATGTRASRAVLYTDDRFAISVTAWNAPERDRAEPVLSEEQVVMIAQDDVWLEEHQ